MALANHEWKCSPTGLRCIDTSTGYEVGSGLQSSISVSACGNVIPRCSSGTTGERQSGWLRNPGMGDWRGRSTYRNFDVAFFGGIPNNSGDTRFRTFNPAIPATGEQTIIIDEPVLPAVVQDAPKVVRKNIVPFTAAVAGAVLGYYVFDSLFKFRFSNYVGVIAGGALGYGLTNKG